MAVYRAEISKSQFLKEDSPIVKDRIFYIVFKVGQTVYQRLSYAGNGADPSLDKFFDIQITLGSP